MVWRLGHTGIVHSSLKPDVAAMSWRSQQTGNSEQRMEVVVCASTVDSSTGHRRCCFRLT